MALAWALRDPRMTTVLVGASSVGQLEQNVAALSNLTFSDDELRAIDEHAVDSGIDLWKAPRTADRAVPEPWPRAETRLWVRDVAGLELPGLVDGGQRSGLGARSRRPPPAT